MLWSCRRDHNKVCFKTGRTTRNVHNILWCPKKRPQQDVEHSEDG